MGSPIEAQGGQDDAAEWIEWAGGECPVPGETVVQTLMRCETPDDFNPVLDKAKYYGWLHEGLSCDVIAYRVLVSQ